MTHSFLGLFSSKNSFVKVFFNNTKKLTKEKKAN